MTLIPSLRLFRRSSLSRQTAEFSRCETHVYALMKGEETLQNELAGSDKRRKGCAHRRGEGAHRDGNERRALPGTWRATRWRTTRRERREKRAEEGDERAQAICHATRRMFGGTNKFPLAASTFHGDLGKTG